MNSFKVGFEEKEGVVLGGEQKGFLDGEWHCRDTQK